MKQLKFSAAFLFVLVALGLNAQNVGIQLGLNYNTLKLNGDFFETIPFITDSDFGGVDDFPIGEGSSSLGEFINFSTEVDLGYNVGVTYEYDFNEALTLQVAGLVSKKGYKARLDLIGSLLVSYLDIDMYTIDLPANLKYKIALDNGKKFYLSAGPYFSYGVHAKETMRIEFLGLGSERSTNLIWGGNTDLVNKTDYGVLGGFGIDLGKIDIGLQYRLGLANLNPTGIDGMELRQQTVSMNVAYKI